MTSLGVQAAAIGETAVEQQNAQARFGKIGRQDKPVVPGSNDNAVVIPLERLHRYFPPATRAMVPSCRLLKVATAAGSYLVI